jgi:phosphoenolpyruvate synthase/pyruvate phosphate dikinase
VPCVYRDRVFLRDRIFIVSETIPTSEQLIEQWIERCKANWIVKETVYRETSICGSVARHSESILT